MSLIEDFRFKWDLSLFSLIVTNLIVIVFAIIQNWNIGVMILLYVIQSFIIGFFHFLKILNKQRIDLSTFSHFNSLSLSSIKAAKNILAIVYWGFYNSTLFFFLLLATILSITPSLVCSKTAIAQATITSAICGQTIITPIGWIFFGISVLIFFINHLISFITNFKTDIQRPETIGRLIFMPYLRFIPAMIVLTIGGLYFRTQILLFLILKTIVDVYTHNYIHKINNNDDLNEEKSQKIINLSGVKSVSIIGALFIIFILTQFLGFIALLLLPIIIVALLPKKNKLPDKDQNDNQAQLSHYDPEIIKKSISLVVYSIVIFIIIVIIAFMVFIFFIKM